MYHSSRPFFCPPSKHPKSFFRSAILLFVHSSRPPFFPSPILTVRKPKLFRGLRSSRPLHFLRPTSIVYEPKPPFEKKKTENLKFLHRKCQSFGRLLYRKTQSLVSAITFKIHQDKSPFSVKPLLFLNRHQTEK
ncbi:hypothetical protein IC582_001572 [Cucumis melo]